MNQIGFQALVESGATIGDIQKISNNFLDLPENRNLHYDPESELTIEIQNQTAEEILQEIK